MKDSLSRQASGDFIEGLGKGVQPDPLSSPAPPKSFPLSLGGGGLQGRPVIRLAHGPKWRDDL